MTDRRTIRLRWVWWTTKGGPVWLCIGGHKPLAHLPTWRRRLLHLPAIRWQVYWHPAARAGAHWRMEAMRYEDALALARDRFAAAYNAANRDDLYVVTEEARSGYKECKAALDG